MCVCVCLCVQCLKQDRQEISLWSCQMCFQTGQTKSEAPKDVCLRACLMRACECVHVRERGEEPAGHDPALTSSLKLTMFFSSQKYREVEKINKNKSELLCLEVFITMHMLAGLLIFRGPTPGSTPAIHNLQILVSIFS